MNIPFNCSRTVILAALGALLFSAPASAGERESRVEKVRADVTERSVTKAIEEHGKTTHEDVSLVDVSTENDCNVCTAYAYAADWELCDYAETYTSHCVVKVKDSLGRRTEYTYAYISFYQSYGTDSDVCYGGGGGFSLDDDDFLFEKGKGKDKGSILEIPSLGIICESAESPSNHNVDDRGRRTYDNDEYSRWSTKGRHEAADVTGMEHQLQVPYYTRSWMEHFVYTNRYGYIVGGKG